MRVAIIGTGLVGGSVGAALTALGHDVVGWDPAEDHLRVALERSLVSRAADTFEQAVDGADVVVLAGPPRGVVEGLGRLSGHEGLVIDVCGVKQPVLAAAADVPRFVGTHPMAGREHGGPEHATPGLFRGATWVIVSDGATADDLTAAEELVRSLGATPTTMTAVRHDAAVAAISHLPQLVAASLVAHATDESDRLELAAGSFRDLTRVALSDPAIWVQVLPANGREVSLQLRLLADRLRDVADVVEAGDTDTLGALLTEARGHRRALAPPVAQVGIILEDRPGELGRVGAALAASRVDVRDLQLRHGRHGGGGVLTLSVRPGEAEPLTLALVDQGFELA